jgi:L-aspartate oxidase
VAGECASTGFHGANRLASNSLLEAIVFGARVANDVRGQIVASSGKGVPPAPERFASPPPPHVLRDAMTRFVGLERNGEGLKSALAAIEQVERVSGGEPALLNMTATAKLVAAGALSRKESRGAHYRRDFPRRGPMAVRTFLTLDDAERITRNALESMNSKAVSG